MKTKINHLLFYTFFALLSLTACQNLKSAVWRFLRRTCGLHACIVDCIVDMKMHRHLQINEIVFCESSCSSKHRTEMLHHQLSLSTRKLKLSHESVIAYRQFAHLKNAKRHRKLLSICRDLLYFP